MFEFILAQSPAGVSLHQGQPRKWWALTLTSTAAPTVSDTTGTCVVASSASLTHFRTPLNDTVNCNELDEVFLTI